MSDSEHRKKSLENTILELIQEKALESKDFWVAETWILYHRNLRWPDDTLKALENLEKLGLIVRHEQWSFIRVATPEELVRNKLAKA